MDSSSILLALTALFALTAGQRCPPGDYTCTGSNPLQCGVASWECDGQTQCANGADEANCGPKDDNTECCRWASLCECQKNRIWMLRNCKRSCGTAAVTDANINSIEINIPTGCTPQQSCDATTAAPTTANPGTAATAPPQPAQDELIIVAPQAPVDYQGLNRVLHQLGVAPLNLQNVPTQVITVPGATGNVNTGHHGGNYGHHHSNYNRQK